jgi:hypothetical protein
MTEWPGGTTAFWFALRQIVNFQELSKNNNTSHSTIVFPLSDAYRILRDIISRHDLTLKVDLSPNEHMVNYNPDYVDNEQSPSDSLTFPTSRNPYSFSFRVCVWIIIFQLVVIQRGSLVSVPRLLHPHYMRSVNIKSLSVIKASYTSGKYP